MQTDILNSSPQRPRSPQKGIPDEDASPLYKTAMTKLYEASWKFDRAKNGDLLKTLDNKELSKLQFRTILRSGMSCKLSAEELDELMPLFNNNGNVDGCEFILLFYRLRYEFRSKLLSDRIARDKHAREAQKVQKMKVAETHEKKVLIKLCDDYTEEDLKSSMKKTVDAAVKYDRLMPGAVQLDAFECDFMPPNVFREQLKLVFNIQFSLPELAAFIRHFNKDNNNGDNINCASFIVKFFRMGFHEKSRRLRAAWAEKKRIQEEKERRFKAEQSELEKKNNMKVSLNFTPEDKERAVVKLRTAARLYDKTTPGAMSMKSFEVKEMLPHVFKEQLRRIFNLQVTPPEMGALMSVFDVNGDGVITCEEFTKVFLNMGFEEREKELRDAIERQRKAEQLRAEEAAKVQEELANKNTLKVSYTYTEEEFQSAIHKLLEAAWRYDKNMPGAPCLDAFEAQYMEPHVLKEQLRRAFYMKVSPQELGAIMHYFDPENTGRINCGTFLKKFFKTGYDERNRKDQQWRQHQKLVIARKEKVQELKLAEAESRIALQHTDPTYTEEDFKSAFSKLTEGAVRYSKSGPGAVGLEGFEGISLPPHVFKEQLKLVFNVKISIPELWALVAYFDKDHTGSINCKQFVNQFLRTGLEERDRIRMGWRSEQQRKREKDKQKEEERKQETVRRAWSEVDFEFLEEDFDSALEKFVHLCHQFDRRQLGPAGFAAFDAETLNPAEFKETMKRTFNLKVTMRELGALVTYFDVSSKKVANCSAFLNAFVQVRVQCEEFKGKPDESVKLRELIQQLKEIYKSRIARQTSTDSKPWRQANVAPSNILSTTKKVTKRQDATPPSTAVEKYKLRVMVGRRTRRMDLASKETWPVAVESTETKQRPKKEKTANVVSPVDLKTSDADFDLDEQNETTGEQDKSSPQRNANEEVEQLMGNAVKQQKIDDEEESVMFDNESCGADGASVTSHDNASVGSITTPSVDFRLNIIPSEVLRLTELTELWLCNNTISSIPNQIGDLKQLRLLSLTNNRLESLCPEICLIETLQYLYLGGNKLASLPNLMGRMRSLKEINLSHNKFNDFPLVLTTLPHLTILDLSHNPLTTALPPSITQMKCLSLLNVEDNKLTSTQCAALSKTPWIDVKGCGNALPFSKKASKEFLITPDDEDELMGMLKNRASVAIATKLRRQKLVRGSQVR